MTAALKNTTYEVEHSLIGCLLKSGLNSAARDVTSWLTPEMFSTFQLGQIYSAIQRQALKDGMIDILLLSSNYGQDFAILAEISKKTYGVANLSAYAEKVRQYYQRNAENRSEFS